MLAAILLGATAGRGDPDAMEGAILASQSAAIQHQINYTRSQEFEADRIGIGTMATAGYDPLGMATLFEELNRNSPSPDRVKAVRIPDRSPALGRARGGGAQSRGADRAHPSRGFAQLQVDARAPCAPWSEIRKSRASTTRTC